MMRAPIIFLLPLLLLSFSPSSSATPGDHRGGDRKWLIDGSCKLIAIFDGRVPMDYCTTALRNAPFDEKAKLSLHGLAWVGLNILSTSINATKAKLEQLTESGQNNPAMKNALQHCTSMYSEASHRTKDGLKYMEEKNYAEADRTVSMIQGDGTECELAFTSSEPKLISPLTKENLDTQYLSAMTTLLTRFFDKTYTPWGLPIVKPVL